MTETPQDFTDAPAGRRRRGGGGDGPARKLAGSGDGPARRLAGSGLNGMLRNELQTMASSLGIPGTARMRKGDLIAAIEQKQADGRVPHARAAGPPEPREDRRRGEAAKRNGSASAIAAERDGGGDPLSEEVALVRQGWWLHDARWYQAVMNRFGQEAANELNAEVMRFVARRVATIYAREHPTNDKVTSTEVAATLETLARLMFSHAMVRLDSTEFDGENSWETVVSEHFALRMLKASRSLEGYQCPCIELRAGWFEGIGVQASDEVIECMRDGASVCRFRAYLKS